MLPRMQPLAAPVRTAFTPACHSLRVVACLLLAAVGGPSTAQDVSTAFLAPRFVAPEAILIPIGSPQQPTALSWRLAYHNGLRGPDAPDVLVEKRDVLVRGDDGRPATGVISWKIIRTRNDTCLAATGSACPDMLQIMSLPKGYMAVPESVWVEEGDGFQIHIVPNGVG